MAEKPADTRVLKFKVWGLDVWGHGPDEHEQYGCDGECEGYNVNDRSQAGTVEVSVQGTTYNVGTPAEFTSYSPSNDELVSALKASNHFSDEVTDGTFIEVEGESDNTLYINRASDGRPLLQLERVSDDFVQETDALTAAITASRRS